jgi:hypothetical protein
MPLITNHGVTMKSRPCSCWVISDGRAGRNATTTARSRKLSETTRLRLQPRPRPRPSRPGAAALAGPIFGPHDPVVGDMIVTVRRIPFRSRRQIPSGRGHSSVRPGDQLRTGPTARPPDQRGAAPTPDVVTPPATRVLKSFFLVTPSDRGSTRRFLRSNELKFQPWRAASPG